MPKCDPKVTQSDPQFTPELHKIIEIIDSDYEKWKSDPSRYAARIQITAEICQSYGFDEESKRMASLISIMKESVNQ